MHILHNKFTLCLWVGTTIALVNISSALAGATGTITLQGTVGAECRMTGSPALASSADLGAVDEGGTKQILFGFSCNEPFGYTITSQNGGLKRAADTEAKVVYNLDITLPTDSGSNISDSCTSAEIKVGNVTCVFSDSGTDIATDKTGALDMSWAADPELPVGNYTDSLTISIDFLP